MKDNNTKNNLDKEFYTIGEVANMIGVHRDTLRRWDKAGKLRTIRIGENSWRRYRRKDILDLLNSNETERVQNN